MIDRTFIAAANHLLRDADWALERLRAHAGKRARLAIGVLTVDFLVAADGLLTAAQPQPAAHVTVSVPPALVPRWLADRDAASRQVTVEGDSDFAAAISYVAANLRWDFEEDLS
ncbi:MAG: sterol-binding protein, partial [Burkholderiales bacterium]